MTRVTYSQPSALAPKHAKAERQVLAQVVKLVANKVHI